jgi:hypothetical protein
VFSFSGVFARAPSDLDRLSFLYSSRFAAMYWYYCCLFLFFP